MWTDILKVLSPRGVLGRHAYVGNLLLVLLLGSLCGILFEQGGAIAPVGFLVAVLLVWIFIAAIGKRLADAGRSRAWIFVPLALGLIAFPLGFSLYHPPDVIAGMDPYGKALAVVTIFPVIASAFAQVFAKIVAGFLAMASVWALFAVLLLLPGTKTLV